MQELMQRAEQEARDDARHSQELEVRRKKAAEERTVRLGWAEQERSLLRLTSGLAATGLPAPRVVRMPASHPLPPPNFFPPPPPLLALSLFIPSLDTPFQAQLHLQVKSKVQEESEKDTLFLRRVIAVQGWATLAILVLVAWKEFALPKAEDKLACVRQLTLYAPEPESSWFSWWQPVTDQAYAVLARLLCNAYSYFQVRHVRGADRVVPGPALQLFSRLFCCDLGPFFFALAPHPQRLPPT